MDKKEFEFLLKQGEGLKLEFKENLKITRKEFAEKIGISEDEIKFNLDQLKKQKNKKGWPRQRWLLGGFEMKQKAIKKNLENIGYGI